MILCRHHRHEQADSLRAIASDHRAPVSRTPRRRRLETPGPEWRWTVDAGGDEGYRRRGAFAGATGGKAEKVLVSESFNLRIK